MFIRVVERCIISIVILTFSTAESLVYSKIALLNVCGLFRMYVAGLREQTRNDAEYTTRLNGETQRAPSWPQPPDGDDMNTKMFLIPTKLNPGDRIDISGILTNDPRTLQVNLITGNNVPDYDNIACQLEAQFPSSSYDENKFVVNTIYNGYQEAILEDDKQNEATHWIADAKNFHFGFSISKKDNKGKKLSISVGKSFFQQIELKHNVEEIRFLTVKGDVSKIKSLDFGFN